MADGQYCFVHKFYDCVTSLGVELDIEVLMTLLFCMPIIAL